MLVMRMRLLLSKVSRSENVSVPYCRVQCYHMCENDFRDTQRRHGSMLRKVTDLKDAKRLKELIAPSVFNLDGDRLAYLFDTVYASPRRILYIWEEDGKPVGILGIERVGRDAALLLHIAVDQQ